MSSSPSKTVWLVCPKCRSRREVPRSQLNERICCRQCSTEIHRGGDAVVAEQAGAIESQIEAANQVAVDATDDLAPLADTEELVPEPAIDRIAVFRSVLPAEPELEKPPETWVAADANFAHLGTVLWGFQLRVVAQCAWQMDISNREFRDWLRAGAYSACMHFRSAGRWA